MDKVLNDLANKTKPDKYFKNRSQKKRKYPDEWTSEEDNSQYTHKGITQVTFRGPSITRLLNSALKGHLRIQIRKL